MTKEVKTPLCQRQANLKYSKKNRINKSLTLNKKYDMDIIHWLDSMDNVTGYLKELIRKDIKRHGV